MGNKHLLYISRPAHIRIFIGIPAIMVLCVLSAGILTLSITRLLSIGQYVSNLSVGIMILSLAGFYCVIGFLLAKGIIDPIKKMRQKGEKILPVVSSSFQYSEINGLSDIFDKMYLSLNNFITDHQILENLPEGLIVFNESGVIIRCNRIAEEIFGYDIKGKRYHEIISYNSHNMPFLERIGQALRGEGFLLPQEYRVKVNGKTFVLWISIANLREEKGIVIYIKDMQELKRIREQIMRTENLAGLGTLASILSHEIRNPLGAIRGLLEILGQEMPENDQRKGYIERILHEIDRLSNLSGDLLNLINVDKLHWRMDVNINSLLVQSLAVIRQDFQNKNINIEEKYDEQLPLLKADPEKLVQAFTNIIINALQATPMGGKFSVTTERVPSFISIQFRNSGSFIPLERRESIFLPTFSTKNNGTGFGLFVAQRIIVAHNGSIEVESTPEEGTTFVVKLSM